MDARLNAFVEKALMGGGDIAKVREQLIAAKWPADEVDAALASWTVIEGTAVPRRRASLAAGETFLYLLMFATFFMGAGGMLDVLFGFINSLVPDQYGGYGSYNVRWGVSALIVAFPVYAFCYATASRGVRKDPEKRESAPRRWLIYLTLFASSITALGSLVSFIGGMLAGEGNVNGGLKIVTVIVLASCMFWNYLWELRRPPGMPSGTRRTLVVAAITVILGTIAGGLAFSLTHQEPKPQIIKVDPDVDLTLPPNMEVVEPANDGGAPPSK